MTITPHPTPDPTGPGQESCWAYPRPAICQPTAVHLRIVHRGIVVADTNRAIRTLETSHPPSYYIPPEHITPGILHPAPGTSFCEWKGHARYWTVTVAGQPLGRVAWSYPAPTPPFAPLRDHVAFYAAPFDSCTLDGQPVTPQPGGFYGGWITPQITGPFKGPPGTQMW